MNIKDPKDVAETYLQNLMESPLGEQSRRNNAFLEKMRHRYERFSTAYRSGLCDVCDSSLDSFDPQYPCVHWLLLPNGFKKRDFREVTSRFELLTIQRFLRWIANQETYAKNINDLRTGDYLIRETIAWKSIEWSISCQNGDLDGHGNNPESKQPHYHFQMRIDGKSFIKFNEYHLPMSYRDVVQLEILRNSGELECLGHPFGDGMNAIFKMDPEDIINNMTDSPNTDDAMLSVDTIVMAKPGESMDGELIYDLIQKARKRGESLASAARRIENVIVNSTIEPGRGVIEESPRPGRRRKVKQN